MTSADRPATRLATRLAFLAAGFGLSSWAPLVPFAKDRLAVDDGVLGVLLLCLGVGSVIAMLATGILSARYGSKPIIIAGGLGLALFLPMLALAPTPLTLGLALLFFGGSLGSLDVAMNVHAVEVEQASGQSLMSGFHGLFSVGGIAGAGLMTFLLSMRLTPAQAAVVCAILVVAAMIIAWPRLLKAVPGENLPLFVVPKGIVLLLALLAAICFLVEGAVLDWGALLITGQGLVPAAQGGIGFILFSIAMTIARLTGDAVVSRLGQRRTLFWGSVMGILGFAVLLLAPIAAVAMAGFLLIGFGLANLVPILFSAAGRQSAMPVGLAVASITTAGYAGILVGPAGLGFIANSVGLPTAFWMLVALLGVVMLTANTVARQTS